MRLSCVFNLLQIATVQLCRPTYLIPNCLSRSRLTDSEVCLLRLDCAGRMWNLVCVCIPELFSKTNHCSSDQVLLL